jgi:hypothetical protein
MHPRTGMQWGICGEGKKEPPRSGGVSFLFLHGTLHSGRGGQSMLMSSPGNADVDLAGVRI